MDESPKNIEIINLLSRMGSEIRHTAQAYWVFREIMQTHLVPESADGKDGKIIRVTEKFFFFFKPIERALWDSFIIGLCKPFENQGKPKFPPLTIIELRKAKGNSIDKKFVKDIENLKLKYATLIEKLKTIRDKQCAHTDFETITVNFLISEIESLICDLLKWFDKLSISQSYSFSPWQDTERDVKQTFEFLLKNLKKAEEQNENENLKKFSLS